MKKTLSLLLVLTLAVGLFVGCGTKETEEPAPETPVESSSEAPVAEESSKEEDTPVGQGETLYYLNFKPEVAEVYEEIAKAYEEETGVKLSVRTAASGTYEQTLKAEITKTDAPTIFQINGPKGYASWKDYTADLSDTKLYSILNDKGLAITDGDGVYGIPYVVEGYGIIYNNAIMDRYFALDGRQTEINSMDEIRSFDALQKVVEDMSTHKDALEIEGVFASTSLAPGEDWRWQTHLANIPVTAEFETNDIDLASDETGTIEFLYADNFKNIFDLYINNSITEPTMLGSMQVGDSMAEFATGEVAMVQNGNWAWNQILEFDENVVSEDDIKYLPIYTGIPGEENQGLAIGTENFFAINKEASEEQQQMADDFLYWLYSSETGKNFVINELNFIAPFTTFEEGETPNDPLAKEINTWMNKDGISSVPWNFTVFPSQNFKDAFGADLLQYAQGKLEWSEVVSNVIENWEKEATA